MNILEGINEDELSNLSIEILDYVDRISEIFVKLDTCMEKLSSCYNSEACNKILDYYENLRLYYNSIKNNIISYSDDFICLIKKMRENDKYLTKLFNDYTVDTKEKIKSVND